MRVRDAKQLAEFAEYLKGNLAKKVNRLVGWRGPVFERRYDGITISVELAKLLCWKHLDDAVYRERVAEIVQEIEREAWERHRRDGTVPAGAHWILQQDPKSLPRRHPKRSPRPAFHAATKSARKALEEACRWFEAAYRTAAARLRAGGDPHGFPERAFPPAAAFVAA